ncbi:MAG: outer membrane lipid asymmetry maintenance protein MlaD [Deltaproteobacteria bacterium]|nr:outer membrane lipid asymmetry maintenance protein MlaD [Deltaproteobacteria bacterium]
MKTADLELFVGFLLFCLAGVLVYASLHFGQVSLMNEREYALLANFTTVGGLQNGAAVEIAGVKIGRVEQVGLDNYQARVQLKINNGIALYEDTKVAIKTKGLIGERYVEIIPGKSTKPLVAGERIRDTESPVDIQELIAKFIFGNVEDDSQSKP